MDIQYLVRDTCIDLFNSLTTCTQEAVRDGGGFGWVSVPDKDELQAYWSVVSAEPNVVALVATVGDDAVGSLQLTLPGSRSEAASFVGGISVFFVHPSFRGRGIGRKLLLQAEQEARERNLDQLNLDVRETQEGARKLYESLGYKTWGTNPRYAIVDGVQYSGFYMSKQL